MSGIINNDVSLVLAENIEQEVDKMWKEFR
jgi:hypothetical protein